ncbi:MAG: glycosyl hydrolase [Cyclobacteriaceae bacterium]|nr:glycosyl hydrolase [Cyclobacteriaceae bacterium]
MQRQALSLCILCVLMLWHLTGQSQSLKKEEIDQLKFRHIGPIGNRVTCAIGIPGNTNVYYTGAASGGIWKTTDGGLNWKPVFDDKSVHSIGALAVAPSDVQVVYAGTGESSIRSNVSIGNGVWKSTDGGETWNPFGLENTGRISRIVVHPQNPDVVYVAALGHAYAPQKERGIYKSTDGGKSWRQVLFVDENTGASDLVMDVANPRILFAGMWQLSLRTWNRTSGGPGSGIHMSTDGGETWTKLKGNGLPEDPIGKIDFATTNADANRIYALIETGDGLEKLNDKDKVESGELWRTDDKGKNWTLVSSNRNLAGRQAYYTRATASPDNPNEIHFMTSSFFTSIDGGRTTEPVSFATQPNWDHHDLWIDPTDGNRMVVAGDGGVSISRNRGKTWQRTILPIAQLYHVTTDNYVPYNVLVNRQDGPSMRGPSRSLVNSFLGSGISPGMWHDVSGGESGFATADPKNPDIVYSSASGTGAVGGVVTRYNVKNRQFRQVEVWPEYAAGHPASEVKYRFQWTFPVLISSHNNALYVTSQVVHRTTNAGQTWQVISPDLTLNDKTKQQKSGGLTPDNIGVEYANVIYAFEESPVKQGVFWAGTNDGLVQLSTNDGKDWTNLTKNITDLPPLGTVRNIEASKWADGKAYITVDFHEVGNFQPYVYRTTDFGKTWKKIVKGIEPGNLNYCRMVKEDPIRKGLLYLGTESTLYVSFDDGENWQKFMSNLPPSPMYWIDVQEHFNDLVIGTYGRGVWILDDLSPLQQLPATASTAQAALFNPKDVYRFQPKTSTMEVFPNESWGQDPPYGASINYWQNSDKDSVKIYITNSGGDTLKTFKQKGKAGIGRVWWDMQGKAAKEIAQRTLPVGAEWVSLGKDRTRPAHISNSFKTYLVPPGKYSISMTTGTQKFTSSLTVVKDPNSDGTLEDVKAQTDMLAKLHADVNQVAAIVNEAELVRRQLYDLRDVLKAKKGMKKVTDAIAKLDSTIMLTEGKLIQLKYTGTGQDDVRYPDMLAGKIGYLAGAISTADFAPADQHKEVYVLLKSRLTEAQSEWDKLMKDELPVFLKMLEENKIGPITTMQKK